MDLKTLCMNNLVQNIVNLPPQLREKVIGESTKKIKKEAEKKAREKIVREVKRTAGIVIEDVMKLIIESQRTGQNWVRPKHTRNIDDDLYYIFVNICEEIVLNNSESLVFGNNSGVRSELNLYPIIDYDDLESDSDSYI
jgi:hypothetical protein